MAGRKLAAAARAGVFACAALVTAAGSVACGPGAPPPPAARRELQPQWQDVFDATPDVYIVVRPQAFKRDPVYGAFFKSLMRIAQARTEMRGVSSIEAMEGSEEIIVGLHRNGPGDDAAMIFRGVPANLDVAKMTTTSGQQVFRLVDAKARVPEYEWVDRQNLEGAGSLFVLPDRTWVGTMGDARGRARQAFASPFGRPAPRTDPEALATVRLDGSTFGPRFQKSQLVGPLLRRLRSLSLSLRPGKGGVVVSLTYEDDDASAWSEMHVKRVLEELQHAPPADVDPPSAATRPGRRPEPKREQPILTWIKEAKVGHEGKTLVLSLPVPARLLEDLPNASGADLPF